MSNVQTNPDHKSYIVSRCNARNVEDGHGAIESSLSSSTSNPGGINGKSPKVGIVTTTAPDEYLDYNLSPFASHTQPLSISIVRHSQS